MTFSTEVKKENGMLFSSSQEYHRKYNEITACVIKIISKLNIQKFQINIRIKSNMFTVLLFRAAKKKKRDNHK